MARKMEMMREEGMGRVLKFWLIWWTIFTIWDRNRDCELWSLSRVGSFGVHRDTGIMTKFPGFLLVLLWLHQDCKGIIIISDFDNEECNIWWHFLLRLIDRRMEEYFRLAHLGVWWRSGIMGKQKLQSFRAYKLMFVGWHLSKQGRGACWRWSSILGHWMLRI